MTVQTLQNSMMHLRSASFTDYGSNFPASSAKRTPPDSFSRNSEPNETTIAAMLDARRIIAQLDEIHLAN